MQHQGITEYQPQTIEELHQIVENKTQMEKIILFSSIIVIGVLYVWILASYWIRKYKDQSLRMLAMWKQHPPYKGSFPYLPGYHTSLTKNPAYYTKIRQAEMVKSMYLYTLAVPILGWAIVLITSLGTLGIVPVISYYVLSGPSRYVKMVQENLQDKARAVTSESPDTAMAPFEKVLPRPMVSSTPEFASPQPVGYTKEKKSADIITQAESSHIYQPHTPPSTLESSKPVKITKITTITEPFFCQVCEASRPATMQRKKCELCSRYVCDDCFTQMVDVGKTDCPMCGGHLSSQ